MVSVVLFKHSSSLIKIPEILWYTKNSVIMYVRKTRQYKEGFLRFGNKKISLRLVMKRRQKNRKKLEQESDISSIWMKWDLFHIIHIFFFFAGSALFDLHQYDKYELFVFSFLFCMCITSGTLEKIEYSKMSESM